MKILGPITKAVDAEEADEIKANSAGPEAFVSLARYRRDIRRVMALMLIVGAGSGYAAFTSFRAGARSAQDRVARVVQHTQDAHDSVFDTCVAGVDLRLSVAEGLESLRRTAITKFRFTQAQQEDFLRATQRPVDALLTQAAGREYHAPFPPGSVTQEVRQQVTAFAKVKCAVRADKEWPLPNGPTVTPLPDSLPPA